MEYTLSEDFTRKIKHLAAPRTGPVEPSTRIGYGPLDINNTLPVFSISAFDWHKNAESMNYFQLIVKGGTKIVNFWKDKDLNFTNFLGNNSLSDC